MKKFLLAIMVLLVSLVSYSQVHLSSKIFLQGAYSSSLGRHKDVTTAWVNALNSGTISTPPAGPTNALSQPYSGAPFNYPGTESVASFSYGTDILDWVLLELRDVNNPSVVISNGRRAAFIHTDGRIADPLNVTDVVTFPGVTESSFYLVIRHRNHLAVRSANLITVNSAGIAHYDFTTSQSQAFQNPAITSNEAMKNLEGGVFGMWGGNANGMTTAGAPAVRASGPLSINDYGFLTTITLSGNLTAILPNRYHPADMNMDATIRASGPLSVSDYGFLITTVLGGNVATIINQHQ